jgi:transposase
MTAQLRRVECPDHGVLVEQVPFARHRVRFTRDFEDLVAWCASKMDKTAVTRLLRIAWPTVGAIVDRVVGDGLDPDRLDGLVAIGADEISWRKHHNYLTVVVDHASGDVIWTSEGKDTAALDAFFAELGPERAAKLEAVSLDMGKAYPKSVAKNDHAPQTEICWDPSHVVKMGTDALNVVRREHWNRLRADAPADVARRFKGARWALLRNPDDLTDRQADTLAAIRRTGGAVWRAYKGKESLRAIFAGDLPEAEVAALLTAGARGRNARACPRSSSSAAPSARTATASSPPSASACPTAASRGETRPFDSSLAALSVFTQPRPQPPS